MPTFKRLATPLLVAGFVAGALTAALTGVLSAQTASSGPQPSATATNNAAAETAGSEFEAGVAAYRAGDTALAISHWQDAARAGHLGAQWNLTRIYSNKASEFYDPRLKLHYLNLAASQYNADASPSERTAVTIEALVELGLAFWTGEPELDLPAQPRRARSIFEHSATLYGHARAQHYLGLMYLRGEGTSPDQSRALRWLVLAARKHYAPSQATLGEFFWQRGKASLTGAEDRERGLMWFALASQNARNDAARTTFLDRYQAGIVELDPTQRAHVEALVDGWNDSHKSAALDLTQ